MAAINKSSYLQVINEIIYKRKRRPLAPYYERSAWTNAQIIFYLELFIYIYCWVSRAWRERRASYAVRRTRAIDGGSRMYAGKWRMSIELVSFRLWNPSVTSGGHHNREEDVVSSQVAVPPMICIVIFTHNCDLSIPSHNYINWRGGVHKSILKLSSF